MTYIKRAEEMIYVAVLRGDMSIDDEGRIWRTAKRVGCRWTGNAISLPCSRMRAEKTLPSGYLMVRAMVDGVRWNGMAHRLVWRHLHGPLTQGLVVNHKNGIKSDNRPSNLELVTPSDNAKHAVHVLRRGTTLRQWGGSNPSAKLTERQVEAIRSRRAAGEPLVEIARDFGVVMQTISRIARGDRRQRDRGATDASDHRHCRNNLRGSKGRFMRVQEWSEGLR